MKRIVMIVLALTLMLASLSACSSQSALPQWGIPDDRNEPLTPVTQPQEDEEEIDPSYQAVLKAIAESLPWDAEPLYLNGEPLSAMYYGADSSDIGYALHDVNGDGVKELVVAEIAQSDHVFLDLFTLCNGRAKLVCSSDNKTRYSLRTDGTILYTWSVGMGQGVSGCDRYRLDPQTGELTLEVRVCQDMEYARSLGMSNQSWFVSYTDTDRSSYSAISQVDATAKEEELTDETMRCRLSYTPLSELTFDNVSDTVDTQAPKPKTMMDYRGYTIGDVTDLYGIDYKIQDFLYMGGWGEIVYPDDKTPVCFFYSCYAGDMGKPVSNDERVAGVGLGAADCEDQTLLIHEGAPITMKASDYRAKFPDGVYSENYDSLGMLYSYTYNGCDITASWHDNNTERAADWIVISYN
ncbi:MAG: hypothetical protein IJB27_04130 [Clostridia bacterium]|nr:hypothetical protein [Clostridia bacterium]